MRRKYPKAESSKFLMCEQIRPEMNKKMTIIGLFAGDAIVFQPETLGQLPYALPGLAFLYVLNDGLGTFDANFKLLDPENKPAVEVKLSPIKFNSEGANAVAIQLSNVQFNSEGVYKAILQLEEKKYSYPITISSASATDPQ